MKKRTHDIVSIILIIVVVCFIIFVTYYMISNKEAFINNPFVYGADKMGGDVECNCFQKFDMLDNNNPLDYARFGFNSTTFWSEQ